MTSAALTVALHALVLARLQPPANLSHHRCRRRRVIARSERKRSTGQTQHLTAKAHQSTTGLYNALCLSAPTGPSSTDCGLVPGFAAKLDTE